MINFVKNPIVFQHPFPYVEVRGALDQESARLLRRSFPRNLDLTIRGSGTDKTYIVSNKRILGVDGTRWTRSAAWNRFLDSVLRSDYHDYLSGISGASLRGALVEVDVNAYGAGGYMSAHTDRPEKVLSHIIYLSPYWDDAWGGELALLDGAQGRVIRSVRPEWPTSILLPRSDQSWHSVAPVALHSPTRRSTIQISFWSREPPLVASGRIRVAGREGKGARG